MQKLNGFVNTLLAHDCDEKPGAFKIAVCGASKVAFEGEKAVHRLTVLDLLSTGRSLVPTKY